MPGHGVGLNRRWLTVLVGLLMVGGLLVISIVSVPVPARGAVGVDPRVPGPSNPVGPVDFVFSTTYSSRVIFDSGGSVVLEDVRFLDGFEVRNGTAVTVRDCYVHAPQWYGAEVAFDGSSLVMEDCQIGSYDEAEPGLIGVEGDNVTLRRVKIEGYNDGIRAGSNSLYEQVWVTNMRGIGADPHTDGLQDLGDSGGWTMRYSRIDAVPHPNYFHYVTSALLIKTDFGPIDNVTLEGNYFNGGAYTVYSCSCGTSYPAPTNVTIRNNAFGRGYAFGVVDVSESNPVWENNYYADTGQQIDQYGDPTGDPSPGPGPDTVDERAPGG